jgi:hypothetical protein
MTKKVSLSIIISGLNKSKEDIILTLVDIDYYLSNLRYTSFEILIANDDFSEITKSIDVFSNFIPSISLVSFGEVKEKISGENVFVINSLNNVTFENFKEVINISKTNFDLGFINSEKKDILVSILGFKLKFLKKIFRIRKNIKFISNKGIAYFDNSTIKNLPIFDFPKSEIIGLLSGMKVQFLDFNNKSKLSFFSYIKILYLVFIFGIKKNVKKIWKK